MPRSTAFTPLLLAAALATLGCSNDTPASSTELTTPVSITETFADSLNPNGGRTHAFAVQTTGQITANLTTLAPDSATVIGLSLGTWNASTSLCQVILANDNATQNSTVVGAASGTGSFCVRVYDVGKLTANVEYTITVTHF